MIVPATRGATYEDLLAAPRHALAQIIDGDLYLLPRPAKPHALATSVLGWELGPPFHRGRGGPGGWIILDEPELHLERDVLVPDLAGWRRTRMPVLELEEAYFELAPDWVCEVLSPSTALLDRTKKLDIYGRENVPYLWFIDPIARTLEVYVRESGWRIAMTAGGDDRVRAVPFEAIELDLSALWADQAPGGSG